MNIFPAIDIIEGKAVRLLKGDYDKKTVYAKNPVEVAKSFEDKGAEFLHVVDLDGAKSGDTPNYDIICDIVRSTSLKVEIGGGIRSEETIKKYTDAGVLRVILGTVAVQNADFTQKMTELYKEKIAVGVDILDGYVATKGWTQISEVSCEDLFSDLEKWKVQTAICTDISKDGAMSGTNLELYRELKNSFSIDIVASGGVSSMDDISSLKNIGLYGAILGKALYEGAIDLTKAIEVTK